MVTSVGAGGSNAAWGIPVASHSLNITIGGVYKKVVEKDGQIQNREHLCVTVSFNHDIIDGGPASRFMRQFMKTVDTEIKP